MIETEIIINHIDDVGSKTLINTYEDLNLAKNDLFILNVANKALNGKESFSIDVQAIEIDNGNECYRITAVENLTSPDVSVSNILKH